jgi:hypothetical protein
MLPRGAVFVERKQGHPIVEAVGTRGNAQCCPNLVDGFGRPSGGAVYAPSFLLPPLHPLVEPVRLGYELHDLSTSVIFLDLDQVIDHTRCDAELPTVHWRHAISTNPVTQMSVPHPRIAIRTGSAQAMYSLQPRLR